MKCFLFTLLGLCILKSGSAQNNVIEPCAFDEYIHRNRKSVDQFEATIQNYLRNHSDYYSQKFLSNHIKVIPVVVHIIHNNGVENISEAQILSQIQILNEDYRKVPFSNGDGNGVDTEIQFCLAKISPNGNCTDGIVRIKSTLTELQTVQSAQLMALSHWDPERYLNLYVVKSINGGNILGYASFPGGPADEDGFVCAHSSFGNLGTASTSLGRTATHECGHWFGLYHTFNNGCGVDTCYDGDYVCDTPPVASPNFGCPEVNSCSGDFPDVNDQVENYMDYTNDGCKSMFTEGQKERARATLDTVRTAIWDLPNILATGCDSGYVSPPCPAVADFTTSSQTICIGNSILFTNRSLNNCTAYQWNFPGGNPNASTELNPTVTYNTVGSLDVSLIATNINGTDSISFTNYITVVNPPAGQPLPFSESFESEIFPPNGITIDNPDAEITWELDTIALQYDGFGSAKINNLINTNYGQADALILPNIDLSSFGDVPFISFSWAYAKSDPNYSDELSVQISTDCGVTFTQIFYRTGSSLTTGPTQATPYIPDSNTIWKLCNVSLADYVTSNHAIIKIVNVTDGGNNLYIDDINIGLDALVGIEEDKWEKYTFSIWPNPATNQLIMNINNAEVRNGNFRISVYDVFGNLVHREQLRSSLQTINISGFSEGVFLLVISSATSSCTNTFIVERP